MCACVCACDGKCVRARESIQDTNLHVLHIKNASLDILISSSYEELLQMKWRVRGMKNEVGKKPNEKKKN